MAILAQASPWVPATEGAFPDDKFPTPVEEDIPPEEATIEATL